MSTRAALGIIQTALDTGAFDTLRAGRRHVWQSLIDAIGAELERHHRHRPRPRAKGAEAFSSWPRRPASTATSFAPRKL
jgi:hypothetical protein